MGLIFAMRQDFFEKTEFRQKLKFRKKVTIFCAKNVIFLSFRDIFTLPNACVIQISLGTNELLNTNCAREYGVLAKRIRK